MKQITLAKKIEISPRHLSNVKHGQSNMTIALAKKLERVTGISRCKWLCPDKCGGNPWIELESLPETPKQEFKSIQP